MDREAAQEVERVVEHPVEARHPAVHAPRAEWRVAGGAGGDVDDAEHAAAAHVVRPVQEPRTGRLPLARGPDDGDVLTRFDRQRRRQEISRARASRLPPAGGILIAAGRAFRACAQPGAHDSHRRLPIPDKQSRVFLADGEADADQSPTPCG